MLKVSQFARKSWIPYPPTQKPWSNKSGIFLEPDSGQSRNHLSEHPLYYPFTDWNWSNVGMTGCCQHLGLITTQGLPRFTKISLSLVTLDPRLQRPTSKQGFLSLCSFIFRSRSEWCCVPRSEMVKLCWKSPKNLVGWSWSSWYMYGQADIIRFRLEPSGISKHFQSLSILASEVL